MPEQKILTSDNEYRELDDFILESGESRVFLVCGKTSIDRLRIGTHLRSLKQRTGVEVIRFDELHPNPDYSSVIDGVRRFRESGSRLILAVGGGSPMDVAKCIKLFAEMDPSKDFLKSEVIPNDVTFAAVPTTAGTGSEATRFAVIYRDGEKQSVSDPSCIPSVVLFDPDVLKTLPDYQKKATMMDAFCHAVESFWSVNSNDESRALSAEAINGILKWKDSYLANETDGARGMLEAANLAGRAINITQTTAGHAMCYKLTTLYGLAHGHAAALCVASLWSWMLRNTDRCSDPRGPEHLRKTFRELAAAMGKDTPEEAADAFGKLAADLGLEPPAAVTEQELTTLINSVNETRLRNNPVLPGRDGIEEIYRDLLNLQKGF